MPTLCARCKKKLDPRSSTGLCAKCGPYRIRSDLRLVDVPCRIALWRLDDPHNSGHVDIEDRNGGTGWHAEVRVGEHLCVAEGHSLLMFLPGAIQSALRDYIEASPGLGVNKDSRALIRKPKTVNSVA